MDLSTLSSGIFLTYLLFGSILPIRGSTILPLSNSIRGSSFSRPFPHLSEARRAAMRTIIRIPLSDENDVKEALI